MQWLVVAFTKNWNKAIPAVWTFKQFALIGSNLKQITDSTYDRRIQMCFKDKSIESSLITAIFAKKAVIVNPIKRRGGFTFPKAEY